MKTMQWIQKILFYMNGRYGYDEFSKVLVITGLVLGILANIAGGSVVSGLGVALVAYGGLRVLSKEKNKRYKELQNYIKVKQSVMMTYRKWKNRWAQRNIYKITRCPDCRQKVRVPRGKKKIRITCPSCQNAFIKKT